MMMIRKIIKRDGNVDDFNPVRITNAIWEACSAVGEKDLDEVHTMTSDVIKTIENDLDYGEIPDVSDVQDTVEKVLMERGHYKTAKAYILYRQQHEDIRKVGGLLEGIEMIDKYLDRGDWKVKENSNMSYSLQGLNVYAKESIVSDYWLNKIYSPKIGNAHESGDIHIHDLGTLGPYCVGWDLKEILTKGFKGAEGKIESKPAKHFNVALMQIVNYLYTLQGEAAGAQAISNFDTLLAPFIRHDDLTYEQVKQQMQMFLFNMNVPTRVGFQTPFTNITMDLEPPSYMEDEAVIIGGEMTEDTYSDFQEEMDMLNRAFAEVMIEGDAKNRPFTFPIPTYNITEDFDWDNETLDPVWEMTAKYGIPYFSNYVNSDMNPEDARSMCCFTGDTEVTVKTDDDVRTISLRKLYKRSFDEIKAPQEGEWVSAEPIKTTRDKKDGKKEVYDIELRNGFNYRVTEDHIFPTIKGDKFADELNENDKLLFSSNFPSFNGVGNYDTGKFIGLYLAEGNVLGDTAIQFSIGENEDDIIEFIEKYVNNLASHLQIQPNTGKSLSLFVNGKHIRELTQKFVGRDEDGKYLKNLQKLGKEMLEGIWDGWKIGDGSDKEIYTTSQKLANQMKNVAFMLNKLINVREKEMHNKLNDKMYDTTLYTIHECDPKNGRIYNKVSDAFAVKITNIEQINYNSNYVYCLQVNDGSPYFETSDGLKTHNCRLRLDNRELRKRGGGLFGSNPKTGSIGVVTINLPRIGYKASNEQEFFDMLDERMEVAKESLVVKREVIERLTSQGLHPYSKFYLSDIENRFGEYWKNHFSTIGLVGMNDMLLNLKGTDIGTDKGIEFAEKVLVHMRDKLADYQEETGDIFNLEATPAESTCYRLAKLDDEEFDDIKIYNQVKDPDAKPYYTNSSQLPVGYTSDIFEELELQDPLQTKYTGGTVLHGFLGEKIDDIGVTKDLVRKIANNFELPYYTLTPTFSVCPRCGYIEGEKEECPDCGSACEIYSRVVGYLRPVNQWNEGKTQEYKDREEFRVA